MAKCPGGARPPDTSPFLPGGKARASQTAQSGDFHGPQQFFFRLTQRFFQRLVSSLPNIGFKSSRTAGDDPIQDNSLPAANLDDGSLHFVGGSGSGVAFTQAVEAWNLRH